MKIAAAHGALRAAGLLPLNPGADVPAGTRVGITWSGCDGDASDVPAVVGLALAAARHALHPAGLTWACYSVGKPATTTGEASVTTTTTSGSSTTASVAPVTTTTRKLVRTVLTQSPTAHVVLPPGTIVNLTMHHCPL